MNEGGDEAKMLLSVRRKFIPPQKENHSCDGESMFRACSSS